MLHARKTTARAQQALCDLGQQFPAPPMKLALLIAEHIQTWMVRRFSPSNFFNVLATRFFRPYEKPYTSCKLR